jgi:hypothetical protein
MSGNSADPTLQIRAFIRDGSKVLGAIECINPAQEHLKSAIAYIGRRVDQSCKDGTTTSMLMACNFIRNMLEASDKFENYSIYEMNLAFAKMFDQVLNSSKDIVLKVEDLEKRFDISRQQAIGKMAYIQSLTASGGNIELAKAIEEIFLNMPLAGSSSSIDYRTRNVETEKTFSVGVENCEYRFRNIAIDSCSIHHLNREGGRVYEADDVNLLVLPKNIMDVSDETTKIIEYFTEIGTEDTIKPHVVMVPATSQGIGVTVREFFRKWMELTKAVVIVGVYPTESTRYGLPWKALSINGKANVKSFGYDDMLPDIRECIIEGASVHVDRTDIRISNIIPDVVEGDNSHPALKNMDKYPQFKASYQKIDEILELCRNEHTANIAEITELETGLSDLLYVNKMYLDIGGTSHDVIAGKALAEDCIGSAIQAIDAGIVVNAMYKMYWITKNLVDTYTCDAEETFYGEHDLQKTILDILSKSFKETFLSVLRGDLSSSELPDKWMLALDSHLTYEQVYDKTMYFDVLDLRKINNPQDKTQLEECIRHITPDRISGPPSQTAHMTTELCRRLREVCVPIGTLRMCIIPNAANI